MKACVAITAGADAFRLKFANMIVSELSALRIQAEMVRDGDRRVLDADVLILIGDCGFFQNYSGLFRQLKRGKTMVVLWQLAPLPPQELGAFADRIVSQMGGKILHACSTKPMEKMKKCVPLSLRVWAGRKLTAAGRTAPGKEGAAFSSVDGVLDATGRFVMIQGYIWMRRYISEGWVDHVCASSLSAAEFLRSRGIMCRFVPVGYHSDMGQNLYSERDIDVLFIGTVRYSRRESMVRILRQTLEEKGMEMMVIDRGCIGDERTVLLNRAKISLNLVNHPWQLPGMRFLMSMGCGALVVSEPLESPAPYVPGVHFVQSSVSDLAETLMQYITNAEKRRKIVDMAGRFVEKELTLRTSVSQLLETCYGNSSL